MSIAVTKTTSVAIEEEASEGTYIAPSGAASFVQTLADGLEITPSKELLERNVFTASIGKITPRTGTKSVSGSIGCEFRAHSTAGSAPEYDKLLKSALGSKRQITTETTTKTGNTATVLQIENADITKFNVGDIVVVKESGAYHVSPIIAIDDTEDACNVTLLVPHPAGSISDNVVISKATVYTVAESGHPTLSITRYQDAAVKTKAIGCRVSGMELSGFSTGQIPELNCTFDGLDFDKKIEAPVYTPSYDNALPPIVLDARAYLDGSEIVINELSFSVENTVGFATSISEANGKIASRITERSVTGTFNPYQETDDVSTFTKFVNNTEFSLFAYAKNPTSTAGEFENVVAVYLPKCTITEAGEADAEGLVQQNLTFSASRGASGTTNEIYLAFI